MKNRLLPVITVLILSALILSACNLPDRLSEPTPSLPAVSSVQSSPTPVYLCDNQYFRHKLGDSWEYSGSNTIVGVYNRTDTVTGSSADVFTVATSLSSVNYKVHYGCTSAGLTASDPVQQYAGALLSSPDSPMSVKLSSNSGVSLPAKIIPGDTWQQTVNFEATSQQLNVSGRFVFDYTAVAYENVTVPAGTYNALRVDGTIRIEVTGLHILAGSYTTSIWFAPEVGMVKSEGTSHVTGVDFSDSMQLTRFTPAP